MFSPAVSCSARAAARAESRIPWNHIPNRPFARLFDRRVASADDSEERSVIVIWLDLDELECDLTGFEFDVSLVLGSDAA